MTRPLRVAHVIQNLHYGGMERVLNQIVSRLSLAGVDMHVVVLEFLGTFGRGLDKHATIHEVPKMPWWSLVRPSALAGVFRDIAPDIVHSHSGVWLTAARAAQLARVPVTIHTEHGRTLPIPLVDRLLDHWASRATEIAVAVSEPLRSALACSVVHRSCALRVIPNGVDTTVFQPEGDGLSVRAGLGLPQEGPVVGSVGRLEPVKNFRLAIEALSLLHSMGGGSPLPHLVLVGDGQERAALVDMVRSADLAQHVHFLGWRDNVSSLYRAFDLFTLPSRSEGTSVSLLEAMSTGLCPVVTDVGGNRLVLGEGLVDQLVPDNDAPALAAAWRAALDDPKRRQSLGALARARACEAYSLDTMVRRYAELYLERLPNRDHVSSISALQMAHDPGFR